METGAAVLNVEPFLSDDGCAARLRDNRHALGGSSRSWRHLLVRLLARIATADLADGATAIADTVTYNAFSVAHPRT
jgi:hypothetical protein